MWGEETDPTLLPTVPGGYGNPLVSALGVQPAETWCFNKGSRGPRCGDWGGGVALETEDMCPRFSPGDCVSSPHLHGQDPVPGDPRLLFTCSVSRPLWDSHPLNWGCCPDWPVVPFLLFVLSHSHEVRQLRVGHADIRAHHRSSSQGSPLFGFP